MNEKILVVDDEKDICDLVKETLEYEGYSVTAASSGEEARRYLEGTPYHMIIVDIRLGGSVSGVDIIRDCSDMSERPVILVISATPERLLGPLFIEEGISGFIERVLEKPADLNPERIVGAVRKWLQKNKKQQG